MRIRLNTENGELVTYGTIPDFNTEPKVIIWGDRVFVSSYTTVYSEVFAYVIIQDTISEDPDP
jgi:hypothetical protein